MKLINKIIYNNELISERKELLNLNELMELYDELNIDPSIKRKSTLPRNRLGLPTIRGAGMNMVDMDKEVEQ